VTLTLGIIATLFSALIFTRTVFRWLVEKGSLKRLRLCDLIPKRKFDFLGKRRLAFVISLLLLVGCSAAFLWKGKKNFGIDFLGGDLTVLQYKEPVNLMAVRQGLENAGLGRTATIQLEQGGGKAGEKAIIRSPQGSASKVLKALTEAPAAGGFQVVQQDTVGAQIGAEFARKSGVALFLGMLAILIYVTVRFDFSFAWGAIVALLHDIIITVGVFSLVGGQLSLVMVGAILTIAGYSINNTIVVFDRIREWLHSGSQGTVEQLMNQSINETLGRTILTSGTTILAVAALYFIGGEVLRDFAFAILVGIFVGTYSSLFIAAAVVLWWSRLRGKSVMVQRIGGKEVA
ncbi:MAG: protein translocase subunit SecF, partial [Verrucomicrobia bacterium]